MYTLETCLGVFKQTLGRRAHGLIIGTLRSNDADGNENVKTKRFNKQNNNFARALRFFCTFLSCFCTTSTRKCQISRFKEDVNKQRRNFLSLSELEYGHLTVRSGGFTHIWQSKWAGIIAVKTKRTQIHLLSDVPVAVESLDLKVPNRGVYATTRLRKRHLQSEFPLPQTLSRLCHLV